MDTDHDPKIPRTPLPGTSAHRYAMVLHTDPKHPHVHLVVKAENEQGWRLNIDKAMLREWRHDFAQILRDQGIEANATSRAARGRTKKHRPAAFEHMGRHMTSDRWLDELAAVQAELIRKGSIGPEPAQQRLTETRGRLVEGWTKIAEQLQAQGESISASDVREYVRRMPMVLTDRESIGLQLKARMQQRDQTAKRTARQVEPRHVDRQRSRDRERTR